jgi:hypothetical protein
VRFILPFVFFVLLLIGATIHAQKSIRFHPMFNEKPIEIPYQQPNVDLTISKCQWYITQLRVFDLTSSRWVELVPCQLVTAQDSMTRLILMDNRIRPSRLSFLLGTDSLTNVSGVFEGPLDPINGMYWAWNSGYINFKLEGTDQLISSSDKRFEYHIGGYLPHQKTTHAIELDLSMNSEQIQIDIGFDLATILQNWEVEKHPTIMLPGPNAVEFSRQLPKMFYVLSQ